MCSVSLSSSDEAWGSSGTLNGDAMADILAVLVGSSLGLSLSLEEWEDRSDWRDLLSSGGEYEWYDSISDMSDRQKTDKQTDRHFS